LHPDRLDHPLHWRKPGRVFVNSMSDLFHEYIVETDTKFLDDVFAVMAATPHLTYQVLTKRPQLMKAYLTGPDRAVYVEHSLHMLYGSHGWCAPEFDWPLPNVWLGVSIEDGKTAVERITPLLETPAALRFLSCEPLLGHIDLVNATPADEWSWDELNSEDDDNEPEELIEECEAELDWINYGNDLVYNPEHRDWLQWREYRARYLRFRRDIGWVIVGGESGPGARPMDLNWVRSLRDTCNGEYHVPFFFKQMIVDGKKTSLPELDGVIWSQFPDE
jgi:protein gp37